MGEIASWYQLYTSLPSRSTLHICQKFQWTSKQPKSAYLDFQYFHRRSSKFPVEHLSLLLEWYSPFFIAIILSVQYSVFWVSSFYLSVNIVVLYQFTVTCIETSLFNVRSLGRKKWFKFAIMLFLSSRRRSREERNGFVKEQMLSSFRVK